MLVVDVNEFYSPTGGGVRTYIDRKMSIMADMGHELICIACGKEDRVEERAGGGKIIYVKSPGLPFDKNYGLFSKSLPIRLRSWPAATEQILCRFESGPVFGLHLRTAVP